MIEVQESTHETVHVACIRTPCNNELTGLHAYHTADSIKKGYIEHAAQSHSVQHYSAYTWRKALSLTGPVSSVFFATQVRF